MRAAVAGRIPDPWGACWIQTDVGIPRPFRSPWPGSEGSMETTVMAEPAMTVADAAKHVRAQHDVFCFTLIECVFGPECAMANPCLQDIELTDQFFLHFASKAYLIELGYVGLLAMDQNGLGTLTRASAFLCRVYQDNARQAGNELLSIQNGGESDRTKHFVGILPSSRTGLSPDELTSLWPVCSGVAISGFGNNFLKDMSLPLRRLVGGAHPEVTIVAMNEITPGVTVESVGVLKVVNTGAHQTV